jgi:hypothetical protein
MLQIYLDIVYNPPSLKWNVNVESYCFSFSFSWFILKFFASPHYYPLNKKRVGKFVKLGVSICLDVISIEISISTPKKYQSHRSRKSRRFSKVSLDRDKIKVDLDWSRLSRPPRLEIWIFDVLSFCLFYFILNENTL